MSEFTRKIEPNDLPDVFFDDLVFSPLDKSVNCDDDDLSYKVDIRTTPETTRLLSPNEVAEKYDVKLNVATKIAQYQRAALDDLNEKIDDMINSSERYLQVKPYLNDKKYEHSVFYDYLQMSQRSDKFTRDNFSPAKNLMIAIGGGIVSLALLTVSILATLAFLDGKPLYANLPVTFLAVIWLGYTVYALIRVTPRAYRTRKLVMSLYLKSKQHTK